MWQPFNSSRQWCHGALVAKAGIGIMSVMRGRKRAVNEPS